MKACPIGRPKDKNEKSAVFERFERRRDIDNLGGAELAIAAQTLLGDKIERCIQSSLNTIRRRGDLAIGT